jgi:hypothetical protein
MMTSRSEYRLLLRQDNADERLTPIGRRAGLVGDTQYEKFLSKRSAIIKEKERLESTYISKDKATEFLVSKGQEPAKSGVSLADLIRRPGLDYDQITELDIGNNGEGTQAMYVYDLMKRLLNLKKEGAAITGITYWGLGDNVSWRPGENALLFTTIDKPKKGYFEVLRAYTDAGFTVGE